MIRLMKTNWPALLLILTAGSAFAEVTRIRIDQCEPFAHRTCFGQADAYELIARRLFFEVDPENSVNERITDLKPASRNENGRVASESGSFLRHHQNQPVLRSDPSVTR